VITKNYPVIPALGGDFWSVPNSIKIQHSVLADGRRMTGFGPVSYRIQD
jgi:hypothetical protein